jgi:hypothetical protein
MSFTINSEGLRFLLSGESLYISDGIHANKTEIKLSEEAQRSAEDIVDSVMHKMNLSQSPSHL